jgi:hypothetical protein
MTEVLNLPLGDALGFAAAFVPVWRVGRWLMGRDQGRRRHRRAVVRQLRHATDETGDPRVDSSPRGGRGGGAMTQLDTLMTQSPQAWDEQVTAARWEIWTRTRESRTSSRDGWLVAGRLDDAVGAPGPDQARRHVLVRRGEGVPRCERLGFEALNAVRAAHEPRRRPATED